MTGEANEVQLAGLARFQERLDGAARREAPFGVVIADHFVDLHQIDHLRLQPLERLLELLACGPGGAAVQLGHQECLLPIAVAQGVAHALFAAPAVVVPAVVEEVHPVIERTADDPDALLLARKPEVISADPDDRHADSRAAELPHLCARVRRSPVLSSRQVALRRSSRLLSRSFCCHGDHASEQGCQYAASGSHAVSYGMSIAGAEGAQRRSLGISGITGP